MLSPSTGDYEKRPVERIFEIKIPIVKTRLTINPVFIVQLYSYLADR